MPSNEEIDGGRNGARNEKTAAFGGLVVTAAGIGVMVGRSVLMDVCRAGAVPVQGQAMRRHGSLAECQRGGRRSKTQSI